MIGCRKDFAQVVTKIVGNDEITLFDGICCLCLIFALVYRKIAS
jgi:hypothetical protein